MAQNQPPRPAPTGAGMPREQYIEALRSLMSLGFLSQEQMNMALQAYDTRSKAPAGAFQGGDTRLQLGATQGQMHPPGTGSRNIQAPNLEATPSISGTPPPGGAPPPGGGPATLPGEQQIPGVTGGTMPFAPRFTVEETIPLGIRQMYPDVGPNLRAGVEDIAKKNFWDWYFTRDRQGLDQPFGLGGPDWQAYAQRTMGAGPWSETGGTQAGWGDVERIGAMLGGKAAPTNEYAQLYRALQPDPRTGLINAGALTDIYSSLGMNRIPVEYQSGYQSAIQEAILNEQARTAQLGGGAAAMPTQFMDYGNMLRGMGYRL